MVHDLVVVLPVRLSGNVNRDIDRRGGELPGGHAHDGAMFILNNRALDHPASA